MGTVAKIRVLGLAFLSIILGSSELVKAATYTVAQTGLWSESSTWDGTAPSNTIDFDENITINVPAEMTLTIDEDVLIQHTKEGRIITLSGEGLILIASGKTFFLQNTYASGQNITATNRVNLQCDIDIEENATLELDVFNVAFDFDGGHDITGSGTVYFSRTGDIGSNRCRIQVHNLTKPIMGCNFSYASIQKFTYLSGCTYVLPGTYYDMSCKDASMYVYDNVIVTGNSYVEGGGITYNSKSDNAKMSFNTFSNKQPISFNVDVTFTGTTIDKDNNNKVPSLTIADTNTLTIAGNMTWRGELTLPKNIVIANGGGLTINNTPALPENITIENGGTLNLTGNVTLTNNITIEDGGVLNLSGENVYFANEDLSKTANITGAGTINFSRNNTTNVYRLTNCTDGVTATYQYNQRVTYKNTCTHIISGTYYNMTIENSEITMCGDVTVNNQYSPAQNMAFNCEDGENPTLTLNYINYSNKNKALTFNVNTVITNNNNTNNYVSSIIVGEGKELTISGNTNINQDVTLLGNIEISENSTLNLGGSNISFANGDFSKTANITGASAENSVINFTNSTIIKSLRNCVGCKVTFGADKAITYDNNCTNILAGTYNNLTTNNSGTLTLCGNVVVNGTYNKKNNIIIKGETGNETITFNGPISSNTSLALLVNAFANGTNSYSLSRLNIGKSKTFTINGATTITSSVNIDSTGIINVADDATLTFGNSTTFNTNTTINGNGNVYFNAYVKASGTKLTTYPTVTLADVGSNMDIDTIEVKGGTFNYNRSNNDRNQRPIRSLIVDGGTFALNIPNWASMNLTGAAILKSGTLQMATGKTLKLTNTDCDTLKVTGTATIDGNGVIDAVVAVYANGNLTIAENMTIRQLVAAEDNAIINVAKDKTLTLNSPMQVNGNATLNTEAETSVIFADGQERISVLSGRTLTIGRGNITISNAVITLDGALNIESAGSLTVAATNVNFTRLSNLDGTGAMNLTNSSPIIGSLTTCLGGNVVFEENSTVTYDEMCTRIIPSTYYNLVLNTSVGKNITLCDLVEVSNDLTWNNGRIVLNGNELKLHGAFSVGGTPGLDHMVVADENGKLTYTGLTGDNNLSFPVGSYNSISKTYMYAPVDISGITADAEYSVSVATVGSAVSGLSTDLKRYWNIETTGALGDGGTLTLHYDSADDGFSYGSTLNDEGVGYWKAYNGSYALDVVSPFGGRIITINAAKINEIDGCSISGTWTAAESTKVATLYAHYTGRWDNPDIWTTDPTGKTHVNPNDDCPNKSFDAVILSPYTVRKPGSESEPFSARTVQIALGATIDAGTRSPDFTNVYGQGTLRIDGDFPTEGNYKEFMSKNGGTTEFYGTHATNTITQYEYNNLVLNYTGSSESTLSADKQLLNINGNLTLTHGSLHFSANGQAIHVGGNINIAEGCGIYIYEGGGHHTDTLQVGGSLINHGTIRMTHRVAANYNNAMALSDEGDAGRGIIRFTGEEDARFECYGETRLAQLFLTKGTDHNSRLTVYSDSYDHFSLLGKAKDSYLNKDFSTNMYDITKYTKPIGLWCGTLELTGKIRILSLSEGGTEDGMMFFIPSTAGMHINGSDVEVNVRTDDKKEGWANFISSGHFRIDDGKFDARAGSGISFRGTSFMEINGGTVRCAQFRPEQSVADGVVSYTQAGGTVIVDGQGSVDATMPAFYMPFSANTFIMTGGTILVSNPGRSGDNGKSSSNGGAFVVGCNPGTSSITGGNIIVNTGRASTGNVGTGGNNNFRSDYLISCAIPLWNLTLRNDSLNYNTSNIVWSYTGHRLSDHTGKIAKKNVVDFKCATEIKNDLTICKGVIFKADGKELTIGGNLIIEEGATVETGDNEIIFNGGRLQRLTNNGAVSSTGGAGFYSLTVNSGTQLRPVQNTTLYGTLTLHDGAELVDGVSNIVYTIYGNADISGAHKASAFNGSILFAGNGSQTIAGSGNGLLNNVSVNKTGGTLQLTAPRLTITGDLRLLSNIRFDIGNNNLNLANTANIYTDAYTATAFTADRMIMTSGGASAEGLTRQYSSARKSMLFPIGLNHGGTYYYLPAEISYMEATTFGSVTTRVVDGAHPFSDAGNSLQCYWITDEQGFAGVNNIIQNYWYATTGLVMGTLSNYVPARYHAAEWATEGTAGVHKSDDARYFTFGGAESASGHYTCGDKSESAFAEIMHLYSSNLANGTNWDSPLSWTTTKVGDAPIFENASITYKYNSADGVFQAVDANGDFVPDGATMDLAGAANYLVPTATTAVTIGSGEHNHTIVMNADGQGCASLTLADGSTLDMGVTVDHNFPLVDVETYGAGKLVIGSAYFPGGDFVKFLGSNGGTVEYQNNSGAAFAMPTISTCRNLVISGADAVELPNADIHIYDSLTVNGQAQILGSTSRNITIDGNLNIISGQMLINCSTSQAMVIGGDVKVAEGAAFTTGADGADNLDHNIQIGGSLEANGLFKQYSGKKNRILLTFVGTNTAYIKGSALITVHTITCDKGSDMSSYLIIQNKGLSSSSDQELLKLKNGTCQIDIGDGNEIKLSNAKNVVVESTARLSIKSGTSIIGYHTNTYHLILNGALEVLGGKLYIGKSESNYNRYASIKYSPAGLPSITVSGGQLIVNGAIRRQDKQTLGSLIYNQTGGEVIVKGKNRKGENSTDNDNMNIGLFEVLNTGEFNLSGGTLNVCAVDFVNGASGTASGDIFICPAKSNNSGGQIVVGDGSTVTEQKLITNVSINSLKIMPHATLGVYTYPIEAKDITIEDFGDLQLRGHALTIRHGLYNNNVGEVGDENKGFEVGDANHTTYFVGSNMEYKGASGNRTCFANLQITGSMQLVGSNSDIQVNKKLTLTSNTVTDNGNTITLIGDIENNGKFVSNAETGGIKFLGEGASQYIRGRGFGEFGSVTVANPMRVILNTNVTINKKLTLDGLLYINNSLLTLGKNATVEAAGSSRLDENRMILMNGAQDDYGVRKILPAIPSGSSTEILIPIGIDGNYTPAKYIFEENKVAGASITVKTINYLNRNLAQTPPSFYLDYYWCVSTAGFNEENDENGDTNDNFKVTQEYLYTEALMVDEHTYDRVESDMLPEYQRTLKKNSWRPISDDSYVDAGTNTIIFGQMGHLDGEYTAGVVDKDRPYTELPYLYTLKDGKWNEPETWGTEPNGCSDDRYCIDGHYNAVPDGNPIIIQNGHTVEVVDDGTHAYSLEFAGLESTLNVAETFGNDFGRIYGVGRIQMEATLERPFMFPAGDFANFMADPRSVVIFDSKNRDGIMAKTPGTSSQPLQNVIIKGSYKTKIMASDAWVINGNLTLEDGATLDNTGYNTPIRIGGNWVDTTGSAGFLPGTSTVEFNGDSTQRILIKRADNAVFYGLAINNSGAAGSDSVIVGLNTKDGYKSFRITKNLNLVDGYLIVDTTLHAPVLASSASVSGASAASFVSGPIGREMTAGGSFKFPVGRNGRYAETPLSGVSETGIWMVDYVDSLYSEYNDDDMPVQQVSNEYWRMYAPSASATAKIGLRYDSQTLPSVNKNNVKQLAKLTVVDHPDDIWNQLESTRSNSTLTTVTAQVAQGYENVYSIGYIGTTARFDESAVISYQICDNGGKAQLPILFTGTPDYNLTYKVSYNNVEVSRKSVTFNGDGNLTISGADLGFRSTTTPYIVELVSVTDASGEGSISYRKNGSGVTVDKIEIYVFYNARPEITGDDEVGRGDTREYSVMPFTGTDAPYVDSTYSWTGSGVSADIAQINERVTNVTFNEVGGYTLNAQITYKYSDALSCTNNRYFDINVLPEPTPHIVAAYGLNACTGTKAETGRTYTYSTTAVANHKYEWVVTNGVIKSGTTSNICEVEWNIGETEGTIAVEEWIDGSDPKISGSDSKNVTLYSVPSLSDVTITMPDEVCYGTSASITISAKDGYSFKVYDNANNSALSGDISSGDEPFSLSTTSFTKEQSIYLVVKNDGCSKQTLPQTVGVELKPDLTLSDIPDLYIGKPAEFGYTNNNVLTSMNYTFTYDNGTDNGTKTLSSLISIDVPVTLENLTGILQVTSTEGDLNCSADYAINKPVSQEYLWKGEDSDWNKTTNWWADAVPSIEKSAHINVDGKKQEWPIVNAPALVNTLTIESDGKLTIDGGTLKVAGDLSNAGTFNGTDGKVIFTAGSHAVSGTNTFGEIDVESGATATFGGTSNVKGNIDNDGIVAGTITLNGSSAQTVGGGGKYKNVIVNNAAGVVVDDSPTFDGDMTLQNGKVTATDMVKFGPDGKMLEGGGWVNATVQKQWGDGAKGFFKFVIGSSEHAAPVGITPTANGATFTASYDYNKGADPITENLPEGLERVSAMETWNIDGGATSSYITLYWSNAKASGITTGRESDLVVAHYTGGGWVSLPAEFKGGNSITTTSAVTSYSPFTFGTKSTDPAINPLPVTFVAFTGRQEGNTIVLDWATASENDNNYFEIERSIDGVNYVTIGYVDGAGNSSSLLGYQFTDNAPEQGQLYYRLSQVDFDGNREYADKVVAVLYTGSEIENLTIVPNPTDGLFKVRASGSMAGGRIELLSQAGQMVRIVNVDSFDATIDISDLPSGIYILRFVTDTKVLQQKVVKY